MSKLKSLKECRAAVFAKIDELRTATDGCEMTAEERYVYIERRQAEQEYARPAPC